MDLNFQSLNALAARLPFHLDDTEQVNAYFQAWRQRQDPETALVVDLWTYCFIRRYFMAKFVREPAYSAADLDQLLDRTYRKVERKRSTVRDGLRYASWVSVVCRNTFLNYVRTRRRQVSLDDEFAPVLAVTRTEVEIDALLLATVLHAAIARLPAYLQQVAELRFARDYSYEEIAEITERPLPSVRAYANKALKHLRIDPELRDLLSHTGREDLRE